MLSAKSVKVTGHYQSSTFPECTNKESPNKIQNANKIELSDL